MNSSADGMSRTYGGQTVQARRADRRNRLVAAAIHVLGTHGEGAATMTAICAQAGLTERYFYESFSGRDDALVAALDAVADHVADLVVTAIGQSTGSTADRVRAALSALVAWAETEPAQARVALIESSANPALRSRRHELIGTFASLVAVEASALYGDEVHPRVRANGLILAAGTAELVEAWINDRIEISGDELIELASAAFERLAKA